jgi:hypothetical protein
MVWSPVWAHEQIQLVMVRRLLTIGTGATSLNLQGEATLKMEAVRSSETLVFYRNTTQTTLNVFTSVITSNLDVTKIDKGETLLTFGSVPESLGTGTGKLWLLNLHVKDIWLSLVSRL